MKNEEIARTYAEALFELALSEGELESVHDEMVFLERLLSEDPNLQVFLESPGIDEREKRNLFESVLRGKLSDTSVNFLQLVIRRGRQAFLVQMLEEFRRLRDTKLGILHAEAVTAVPLSAESREALRLKLEQNLGKQIHLDNRVDERILGGLIVRYEGLVADGSLQKALRDMQLPLRLMKFGSELVHEN